MTSKTATSPAHADALDRASVLSTLGAQGCMILLDPALRPPAEDPSWPADDAQAPVSIAMAHPRVDPSVVPQLLTLHPNDESHARMLVYTLDEAQADCDRESLSHGRGRRIGAWLVTPAPASEVGDHLGRVMLQRHALTHAQVWLRLHDPAVLWLLWPELSAQQQTALLGPIEAAYLLDPLGKIEMIRRPAAAASAHGLELTPQQWTTVDATGAANQALRDWSSMPAGTPIRLHAQVAVAAVKRAALRGFSDTSDQALFARLALTVHPRFDRHPWVTQRLDERAPEDYFSGLVADLDEAQWQQIATDLRVNAVPAGDEPEHLAATPWPAPTSTH
ncbi:hypothetical protein J2W24_003152 [Variovorax boronicumulans]|uniref:DUF4123 domain-containing protein n=1 Tax=Variovorax boronicumulans TaxID=436515 RepID=UPI0027876B7B|nr:DUF4123 domain-containing protein [Variovorax boronicumulans]MDP9917501.1 hypothetical protein [Variovorax boronicumulans]